MLGRSGLQHGRNNPTHQDQSTRSGLMTRDNCELAIRILGQVKAQTTEQAHTEKLMQKGQTMGSLDRAIAKVECAGSAGWIRHSMVSGGRLEPVPIVMKLSCSGRDAEDWNVRVRSLAEQVFHTTGAKVGYAGTVEQMQRSAVIGC